MRLDQVTDFPRSKDRGLIEAKLIEDSYDLERNFPRSKDRGLIEAWQVSRAAHHRPQRFPRSKDRGLIENQHIP